MHEIIEMFDSHEVVIIEQLVSRHIRQHLGLKPFLLKNYHAEIEDSQHQFMADKKLRVFGRGDAREILNLPGICKLLAKYPDYHIGDVIYNSNEMEKRPEFYFRLVRPSHQGDVGPAHCDYWFDEAMETGWGIGNTIKFWIPIVIEPGLNGLFFYPDAPKHVPFRIVEKNGLRRPMIDIPLEELGEPVLPSLAIGQALKFRDDVLHAGAPNRGIFTRVSMEITLVKESA